jgi:hypothetical protein
MPDRRGACGTPLVQSASGRRRRYCNASCRQKACRDRTGNVLRGTEGCSGTPASPSHFVTTGPRSFATFAELDQWIEEHL